MRSFYREEGNLTSQFTVTDGTATVNVNYKGILPDLFRKGQGTHENVDGPGIERRFQISTSKEKGVKKATCSDMKDTDLVEVHAKLGREKHPPTKHFIQAPLVFVFLFGCLIFFCAIQLAHTTNDFQLHLPPPDIELTPEEIESNRVERKLASGKKLFNSQCASCHNPDGMGKDLFPPLVGSKWVPYKHLQAQETKENLVCRHLLDKKNEKDKIQAPS